MVASDIMHVKPFIRVVGKLREGKIMVVKVFLLNQYLNTNLFEAVKNYLQTRHQYQMTPI